MRLNATTSATGYHCKLRLFSYYGGGSKMTNEQRISLQAHGLEELPAIGRTVYIHRVEEHLQLDIGEGSQTNFIVTKGQAYELATALIKALVNWEVEG